MKSLLGLMAGLLFMSAPALAAGTGEEIRAGIDYELLATPQPTDDPPRIEVREFFSYGCPHCWEFEPELNAWLRKKPESVVFIRQPVAFGRPQWATYARIYFTADALGVVGKVQGDVYKAIHSENRPLQSEDDIAKFFANHGVAEADFNKVYKSFSVEMNVKQADGIVEKYKITGTPTLVINGKYLVSPGKAKSFQRMIEITDALIRQESSPAKAAVH